MRNCTTWSLRPATIACQSTGVDDASCADDVAKLTGVGSFLAVVFVVFFKMGAENDVDGVIWAALGGDGCVVSFFTTCLPFLLDEDVGAETAVGGEDDMTAP